MYGSLFLIVVLMGFLLRAVIARPGRDSTEKRKSKLYGTIAIVLIVGSLTVLFFPGGKDMVMHTGIGTVLLYLATGASVLIGNLVHFAW